MTGISECVIYVRISKDRVGAGLGVERQEADCRNLARVSGLPVRRVYTDNDLSAYTGKSRPGYLRMLDDLRQSPAHIVTWHNDRLHRSMTELEAFIDLIDGHGILTCTVKAGLFDFSTASGKMLGRQLSVFARFQVDHAVEQITRAKAQSAEKGAYSGGMRPFGYEPDGVTVRLDEAAEIIAASSAVLEGASVRSVTRAWNSRGILTPHGNPWRSKTVRDVLLRERNAGLRRHRDGISGHAAWGRWLDEEQAVWGGLVREDTWLGVKAALTAPGRRSGPGPDRRWTGSGLYLCGICGAPLRVYGSVSHPGARNRAAYRCPAGSRGDPHVTRKAADLDEYVDALVTGWLRSARAEPVRRELAAMLHPDRAPDLAMLHQKAAGYRARLDELARLRASGDIDMQQLVSGSRWLRDALTAAETRIGELSQRSAVTPLLSAADPAAAWAATGTVSGRQAVISALMTVTVLPAPRGTPAGARKGEPHFRPGYIRIGWKTGLSADGRPGADGD